MPSSVRLPLLYQRVLSANFSLKKEKKTENPRSPQRLHECCFLVGLSEPPPPPPHPLQSVGSSELIGRPGAHPFLFGPAGVGVSAGWQAAVAFFICHHLGHQVTDGATHVGGAAEGRGGGRRVGVAAGQGVVVHVLQGVQRVRLAAGSRAHGRAPAGRAAGRLRAGHGGRDADRSQTVRAQRLPLGHGLRCRLLPRVSLQDDMGGR